MRLQREIEGIDLLWAIDLANVVRDFAGELPVDDLVPGVPGDSSSCVLANTFNCDCTVDGSTADMGTGIWYVYFEDKPYAEALAKELGNAVGWDEVREAYSVRLPSQVGRIATQFDMYNLPEYEVDGLVDGA